MILQEKLTDWALKGMEDQVPLPGIKKRRTRSKANTSRVRATAVLAGIQLNLFD
ncbi:hypothetical protein [Zeaxanthinibacter enoshimensis]|uniref:Uncharacterized protein n=1 Tax=Zeaxanthinibacter enoshimensis TaxID=392009 RepID=A0A4R6TN52_9FLAO|nr:hypothetical protein [Zeaxanthinibacter enoshimensis]TDQ31318.1 hypothetical protein CLV82_2026 [Zeaxanthinibacter enoshimensis]